MPAQGGALFSHTFGDFLRLTRWSPRHTFTQLRPLSVGHLALACSLQASVQSSAPVPTFIIHKEKNAGLRRLCLLSQHMMVQPTSASTILHPLLSLLIPSDTKKCAEWQLPMALQCTTSACCVEGAGRTPVLHSSWELARHVRGLWQGDCTDVARLLGAVSGSSPPNLTQSSVLPAAHARGPCPGDGKPAARLCCAFLCCIHLRLMHDFSLSCGACTRLWQRSGKDADHYRGAV